MQTPRRKYYKRSEDYVPINISLLIWLIWLELWMEKVAFTLALFPKNREMAM